MSIHLPTTTCLRELHTTRQTFRLNHLNLFLFIVSSKDCVLGFGNLRLILELLTKSPHRILSILGKQRCSNTDDIRTTPFNVHAFETPYRPCANPNLDWQLNIRLKPQTLQLGERQPKLCAHEDILYGIMAAWWDTTSQVTKPSYFTLFLRGIWPHINPILLVVQNLVDEPINPSMSLRHEGQYDSSWGTRAPMKG